MSFYELHTRSAFSFLSSGTLPEDFAIRAAELGIDGVALLDRDTVSGAVRFHFEAKSQGIKAIIGAEITLDDGSLLPLIPLSIRGYQNLCKLITTVKLRHKKGEHFATRIDIEEHSEDLLCFTGGTDGFIHKSIREDRGEENLEWLKYVFENRLYIELQRHYLRHEEDINQKLFGLSQKFQIPVFASNGAYYGNQRDRELFDVFTCIKNHCTIYEAGKLLSNNSERFLKSTQQLRKLFADIPNAVDITGEIASRINFSMDEIGYTFPDFPVPNGETMDSYLRKHAEKGAIWRYGSLTAKVQAKLDHELNMIEKLKLAGYFLLVWDISEFCRSQRILSQGRGSAANSVVCYALGITAVDPIAGELLFERFLSEERTEYPDIDIDLPSGDDRESVIQHVYQKYGERGAGMTANVISYRGRSAAREVGKVFGFAESELGKLSKVIPYHGTTDREELIERFSEAGFDPSQSFKIGKFMEMYARILDFPRHLGQHSGGMVISLGRLDGVVPLEPASMINRNIIQWDKDDCERMGIVKVDLLGLGMMAALRDTLTLISENYGETVDLAKIPKDDPLVYQTLQKGDTVGMFQVESRAQISFLPKSKPENFYDIVVQVAIIRPGPIVGNMLSAYINRRQGKEEVDYMHPSLEPILKRTLGVPLFQEQLLRMAMTVGGFTGGEAEELRRALGFKRADRRLVKIEERMRVGMSERNIDGEVQDKIVKSIVAFANYGFPESHAASFALLTYASAYLKVHYLAAFTAAILNNYPMGFYSPATLVKDAQRHGLGFKPVDVNFSNYECSLETENKEILLRLGLNYVRGMRREVGEMIVIQRELRLFSNIEDLVKRVPLINKKEIRALSMCGALNFDNTNHRRQALWDSELAITPKGELFEEIPEKQNKGIFIKPLNSLGLMEADLKSTGLTIGKHPMAFLRPKLKKQGVLSAIETYNMQRRDVVKVAGAVIVRQRPGTAKNVMFITLEDETGHSNFVVMPDVFERFRSVIVQSSFLLIKGTAEESRMIKALYFEEIGGFVNEIVSHDFH